MSSSKSPPRIALLPPPGPVVYKAIHNARNDPSSSEVPPLFHDALELRWEVFVKEQKCDPERDIDADDPLSWHWILFASPGLGADGSAKDGDDPPAATIRLVPASSHAHEHDAKQGTEVVTGRSGQPEEERAAEPDYGKSNSGMWDGKEKYAMIGRLATLRPYRGRGYGKVLVEKALDWARGHPEEVGGAAGEHWKGLLLAHAQMKVEGWYKSMGWVRDDGMGQWWEEGIEHVGMWKRVNIQQP